MGIPQQDQRRQYLQRSMLGRFQNLRNGSKQLPLLRPEQLIREFGLYHFNHNDCERADFQQSFTCRSSGRHWVCGLSLLRIKQQRDSISFPDNLLNHRGRTDKRQYNKRQQTRRRVCQSNRQGFKLSASLHRLRQQHGILCVH